MKRLRDGTTHRPNWDKQILTDLSYIKQHLRYPMRLRILTPIVFWIVFSLLVGGIILSSMLEKNFSPVFLFSFIPLLLPCMIILRYVRSLRFAKVQTPYTLAENMAILERFLKAHHLLIFRHPQAPEVFQILSKDISVGKEEREIMIFIADDYRVLVNSQFTQAGWSLPQGKSHVNQMCQSLLHYMKRAYNTTGLQRNF